VDFGEMSENSVETNPDAKWSSLSGEVQGYAQEEWVTASEVAAAAAGGRASTHDEACEQYAGGSLLEADPQHTVLAVGSLLEFYAEPSTGRLWVWNPKTRQAWWHPGVLASCGPTVSLDHTSGDGEQQPTSPTATTLIECTGGEPSPQSFGAVDDVFVC
jgi:hypothetical protein